MHQYPLDRQDVRILEILQKDSRISKSQLAEKVNLSASQCYRRLKRLESCGIIERYVTLLNLEKAGFDVMAFVQVSINQNTEAAFDSFKKAVRASPHILECYSLSGPYDHLMKVVARSNKELSHFILKTLKTFPEIRDAQTLFVLHQVKHTTALPIDLP